MLSMAMSSESANVTANVLVLVSRRVSALSVVLWQRQSKGPRSNHGDCIGGYTINLLSWGGDVSVASSSTHVHSISAKGISSVMATA